MIRIIIRFFTISAGTLALLWIIGLVLFHNYLLSFDEYNDHEEIRQKLKSDAIIVLTGGENRIDTGFYLLEQEYAPKLFISGVDRQTKFHNLLAAILPKTLNGNEEKALEPDSLASRIFLGYDASNTNENAIESSSWVKATEANKIILVTSRYHMPRSLFEFHEQLPNNIEIIPYVVGKDKEKMHQWWKDESLRHLVFSEYHKYIYRYFESLL